LNELCVVSVLDSGRLHREVRLYCTHCSCLILLLFSECVDLYSAYYYYYAAFNAPSLGHKEDESQAQWPLYRLDVVGNWKQ